MTRKLFRAVAILLAVSCVFIACARRPGYTGRKTGSAQSEVVIPNGDPIEPGQTVTTADVSAFTVESVTFTDDIVPASPRYIYSHYPAGAGRTYADVVFAYQNLRTNNVETKNVFSAALYASGQYCYEGTVASEDSNRSDFAFSSVTVIPLATEYVHCAFEIPKAIAESDCELLALITVDQKPYALTIREGSEGDLSAAVTDGAETKLSGELAIGSSVHVPEAAVFTPEDVRFTKELRPSDPGRFSTYYTADDGKIYLDLCLRYCNLQSGTVNAKEQITTKMTYAGKYAYDSRMFVENTDGTSVGQRWSIYIPPLCAESIHFLFEVPEQIASDSEPVTVSLTVDGCAYTLRVR